MTDTAADRRRADAIARIAAIDEKFEAAKRWGSWMVGLANEREMLATLFGLPQRFNARTGDGRRTD